VLQPVTLTRQTFTALCLVGYYIPSPIERLAVQVSLWTRQKPYGRYVKCSRRMQVQGG
jgi:hypothetical protein